MQENQKSRTEQILEGSNKPILFLAVLAILLYLLELFRLIPKSLMTPFLWVNFLIDFIFLIDLLAKGFILGKNYLKSPWFLIDFISTLPIISSSLELMGALGPQLQATRVARGARVARIARVARVARVAKVGRVAKLATAIRARRGLTFLKLDTANQETPGFNKALFIGVPVLLIAFIIASSYITNFEVSNLKTTITQRIGQAKTQADLDLIISDYPIEEAVNRVIEVISIPTTIGSGDGIAVSLSEAYIRADRLSGIMLLILLLTIAVSVMISSSLATDLSEGRERSILSQCFSPAIVKKFYNSPEVIDRFYNQWMTIFFIDIRGFTKAAEKDAADVEGLALKLREVMDTARNEIVVTHEGVIDKFMGDAVMGWVGGHFSSHWELLTASRERLFMDEMDIVDQDIKSIEREIKKIELSKGLDAEDIALTDLQTVLKEAQTAKSYLSKKQEVAIKADPNLQSRYNQQTLEYKRRVAKSAVSCCLKISQKVEQLEDPDAFHELKIGIGSGPVLVGNFGSTDQIGFTVLGPSVNRSARLEPASAQVGCKILIDQDTFELLKDDSEFRFRRVPRIAIAGFSKPIKTYEPFFTDSISEDFLNEFHNGVDALEQDNPKEGKAFFVAADALKNDGDRASKLWIETCEKAILSGQSMGAVKMKK